MTQQLSEWFYKLSIGKAAILAVVVFMLFTSLVLPGQSEMAETCGGGAGSPDTSFIYTTRDLYAMAEAYGAAGRQEYIRARFSFDLVFPLVYTFFLVTCVSWLLGKALPKTSPWRRMNLLPLAAMGFDYLENIAASIVMGRYPAPSALAAFLAPPLTFVKWLLVGGSFFALLAGLVLFLIRKRN